MSLCFGEVLTFLDGGTLIPCDNFLSVSVFYQYLFYTMSSTKEVVLNLKSKSGSLNKNTLIGKIMTERSLNKPTVLSMIKKGWQMCEEVEIHELDRSKSIFLFQFTKKEDFDRVMKGRPWSIQGHLLNLQLWDEFMTLEEVNFSFAPYWIQFHGLPLAAFDEECAIRLGNAVGETLIVESPEVGGKIQRSFIRARILINLNNPLVAEISVPRQGKDPARVKVKYERLQNFCYGCGRIGHEMRGCKNFKNASDKEDSNREFGSWLSTPAVRTIDKNLVICKEGWMEAKDWQTDSDIGGASRKSQAEEDSVLKSAQNKEEYAPVDEINGI